jgi:hypothetical protein
MTGNLCWQTLKSTGAGVIQPEGLNDKKILIEMKICD